jgi:hypothetical protein
MMNALGSTPLEPLLAEDFVYESQAVLESPSRRISSAKSTRPDLYSFIW